MDIELAEPKALAGFDIDRFQPHSFASNSPARPAADPGLLRGTQLRSGGQYLRIDPHNLYFKPQGQQLSNDVCPVRRGAIASPASKVDAGRGLLSAYGGARRGTVLSCRAPLDQRSTANPAEGAGRIEMSGGVEAETGAGE